MAGVTCISLPLVRCTITRQRQEISTFCIQQITHDQAGAAKPSRKVQACFVIRFFGDSKVWYQVTLKLTSHGRWSAMRMCVTRGARTQERPQDSTDQLLCCFAAYKTACQCFVETAELGMAWKDIASHSLANN